MTGPGSVLVVAPHPWSSGEVATAASALPELRAAGTRTHLLASERLTALFGGGFDAVSRLTADGRANRSLLAGLLDRIRPDGVVLADAALLDPATGGLPLYPEPLWARQDAGDVVVVTLDHLGLPVAGVPEATTVLRPSPLGAPDPPSSPRPGAGLVRPVVLPPFVPDGEPVGPAVRDPRGGRVVLHAVAPWAARQARAAGHPLYRHLPAVLEAYLNGAGPVTLVSVNDGGLLGPAPAGTLRVVNLPPQPPAVFARLLAGADLVLTENRFSSTIARAVRRGVPAVAWQHTLDPATVLGSLHGAAGTAVARLVAEPEGALRPWIAFPNWPPELEERADVLRDNPVADVFDRLELFAGAPSADRLCALLTDRPTRDGIRARHRALHQRLASLPTVGTAIRDAVAASPAGRAR